MTVAVSSHTEKYHSFQVLSIFSTSNSEICFDSHAMNQSNLCQFLPIFELKSI